MPRAARDGGGERTSTPDQGYGAWLCGAARPVTIGSGASYVLLGGTRYGLRLSQDSLPPADSREQLLERRRTRDSQDADHQRLSSDNPSYCAKPSLAGECCCIGARARLLPLSGGGSGSGGNSRIPSPSWTSSSGARAAPNSQQPTNNSRACWPTAESQQQHKHQQQPVTRQQPLLLRQPFWSKSLRLQVSRQKKLLLLYTFMLKGRRQPLPMEFVTNLFEPAVTAVDRLQRFRWNGGGGSGGKKSSTSRNSDKAERLRELTEKLKGPAPVPPPRRPSRAHTSSPPPVDERRNYALQQSDLTVNQNTGRVSCRSYTFSEGSHHPRVPSVNSSPPPAPPPLPPIPPSPPPSSSSSTRPRQLLRSESLSEEYYDPEVDENDAAVDNASNGKSRHYRQSSDSLVGDTSNSAKTKLDRCESVNLCENEARDALPGLMELRTSSLYPTQKTGQPYRSASFGQADYSYGNVDGGGSRASAIANARRAAYAASEVRASTLPRVRRIEDSPTPSPPSLADSAVGSSAEGLINNNLSLPSTEAAFRPCSDGSDSLATSSAIASPEPVNSNVDEDCAPARVNVAAVEHEKPSEHVVKESLQRESRIEPHEVIITPPQEDTILDVDLRNLANLRLSQASEASEAPSEASTATTATSESVQPVSPGGKLRRYRGDTSKRRKGVYITQWPEPAVDSAELAIARLKLSGQSSEERDEPPASATPSDLSDCEGQTPRRYSKRPLRGPYGQMLEAEMAKQQSRAADLDDVGLRQRRKVSANLSFNAGGSNTSSAETPPTHHRTTSSPSKLEGLPGPSPELLAELLRGSSERVACAPAHPNDTRTHVVVELYDTERSYVEALQILVNKYLQTLKSPENAHLVDAVIVDEIFYQVPAILSHHEVFLEELRKRLETWEVRQTIGDVFLEVFTKPDVLETYTLFLDNWKSAKKAIKTTCQAKPAFARFLETMEREHKGKLGLDQLLIKPVQKIPRYELLIQRLLKHTDASHPDKDLLTAALKEVHELVVKINCTERQSLEWEQQQTTLKEVQSLVEGLVGIVANDRTFIRHDLVSIASNQGTRKERGLFLFSDLLVITSIKRRSGTIRKPSTSTCPNSLVALLEANKYKMLMRIPVDDLEVVKAKDENLRRMAREVDHLREDCATLAQLQELTVTLHGAKQQLEDLIKDMLNQTQKQLAERNAAHSQLACLELTLNTQGGMENISVMFAKPDKRASWEESFNEAKQKLVASTDRRPVPEFVGPLPIRKTRAGLQFTCAAPTLANGQGARDVWVCNSDGYVGQVCVLSLSPEPPQVTSCNGVCNARILCVAGIPACTSVSNSCAPVNNVFVNSKTTVGVLAQSTDTSSGNIQLDSSSSDDSDSDDIPCADLASVSLVGGDVSSLDSGALDEDFNQPTMWLGTEDGCVHVYNCTDNIRIKRNKVKLQHGSSVHCIIYLDNKVFVSLANGDVTVYSRDHLGGWNTSDPTTLSVGTVASPVTKMLPVSGKLWCASHNSVKILNPYSLVIEHTFGVSSDNNRPISCMASSGGFGVWISLYNSAILKLFHAGSFECLADVNIAPAVTNMLANCDDIIRQHKAACLRVTALLACNELLWIGTSAGVLLTVPIPHIKSSTQRMSQVPLVTGIPHGHTGHVRFLTCVETASPSKSEPRPKANRYSLKGSKSLGAQQSNANGSGNSVERGRLLVISGGDGYEDFRGPQASAELQAGREDSTNHLLLWKV
ncbi:uncharacterized protein LOC131665757 isoform X2 [Phymastichus coffea]|uniref:uncharacterized protein LOC131665757 isoform X2 n=1 Tax=Phymastichus coffea TaxID=108790 RepID=UPI00273CC741|nr:uncharacterized protein LOC131665757 isoform X2 [Phymastichus coffea]